jgi:hypothetical protein
MAKFRIPPDNASYSAERTGEVLQVKLAGGASRFRKDIIDAAANVNCSWQFDVSQFNYFVAFYRTATLRGTVPFTIDLIIDSAAMVTRTARFVADSYKLTGQKGLTYYVSAVLEVEAIINPTETTTDNATIAAFEAAWDAAHP